MPKSPTINAFKRAIARRLRTNSTGAEATLWRRLKQLEMKGSHFRRQMPIGDYVVDFACPAAKLVIEVDGSQHGDDRNRHRDEKWTRWLEVEGYRVLRFWNNDISQNIDGVMEMIYEALYGSPIAEPQILKHDRYRPNSNAKTVTPPRRASRADPPPPGEGEDKLPTSK